MAEALGSEKRPSGPIDCIRSHRTVTAAASNMRVNEVIHALRRSVGEPYVDTYKPWLD